MLTKERIKTHFRENRRIYLACGGTAVIAVVGMFLFMNNRKDAVFGDEDNSENNQKINGINWQPRQMIFDMDITYKIDPLGHPGNVILDETTGDISRSQNEVSRKLDVHPNRVSEHLRGESPHVAGHQLKLIGRADQVELVNTSR